METVRTFIALEFDTTIKETIERIQNQLKKTGCDVKWVKAKDVHLTLKFLGDVSHHKMDSIIKVIEATAASNHAYTIELTHLGAFPNLLHPKVISLGIQSGKEETKKIVSSLEEQLEKIGFKKEHRDFDPHVTIGRVRSAMNCFALMEAIKKFGLPARMNQGVTSLHLVKSTLTPQGPIYEPLAKAELIDV